MVMIIATFVIAISFVVFFYLFANIFTPLLVDIPATVKLNRMGILKNNVVLRNYIKTISIHSIVAFIILVLAYYLFLEYSFGFSVSFFIGVVLALIFSLWKIAWLFFHFSDNHAVWLDFYMKENTQHFDMSDRDMIIRTLSKK